MKKLLLLWLLLPLLAACDKKKKEDTYPAVTSEGLNIWACKINGEPVIYRGTPTFGNENGVFVTSFSSSGLTNLTLHGSLTKGPTESTSQSIEFKSAKENINQVFYFGSDTCYYYYLNDNDQLNPKMYRSFNNSGYLKFDKFNSMIISGQFELKVIAEENLNDTLTITEGRFDIKR